MGLMGQSELIGNYEREVEAPPRYRLVVSRPKLTVESNRLTIWSAKLFQELDKAHILVNLANRDYEGEISGYGDQVKINAVGDVTISNYAPNVTSITPQQLTAAQTVLEIDQSKYFAFCIDDIDNAQTKPKLMGEAMRKSAYGLADEADQLIAGFHSQAGNTVMSTSIARSGADVLESLSDAARVLDENNVPSQGRWIVVPPWYHQLLIRAEVLQTDGSIAADQTYRNGYVGKSFGFDIFMSNNLSTGPQTTHALSHYLVAGVARAMSFAEQVVKVEAYRPENSFADAVKGLHVYGAKVIDPSALVRINAAASAT